MGTAAAFVEVVFPLKVRQVKARSFPIEGSVGTFVDESLMQLCRAATCVGLSCVNMHRASPAQPDAKKVDSLKSVFERHEQE